jgi:hypothetical protein
MHQILLEFKKKTSISIFLIEIDVFVLIIDINIANSLTYSNIIELLPHYFVMLLKYHHGQH